ncbi:VWA containing CoxE family protein [Parafrankia sp. EAN1pec]|uniref:VWA domain-containing protein n=1 Tax=Parafrankia sp. (strain EAN1pec) TaxID=298653 RepID=UPI0000542780|nr:VWA containing CoxE family protein [Frankia sp. EAN1pec]
MKQQHVHTDPTIPAPDPEGEWLRISAAMTGAVTAIAGREDLVVTCAPGAGRGSPGVHIGTLGVIEVDGTLLPAGVDPTTALGAERDARRYPALWGVLTHEGAHAAHTRWRTSIEAHTPAGQAAALLEEARIEAAQIGRRPEDLRWLRAASTTLILSEFLPDSPPGPSSPGNPPLPGAVSAPPPVAPTVSAPAVSMTRTVAAQAAALLLARADAGILTATETAPLEQVCAQILGEDLEELRRIWTAAQQVADDDSATMLRLGQQWLDVVGDEEEEGGPGESNQPAPGGTPAQPSALGQAIAQVLTEATRTEPGGLPSAGNFGGQTQTAGTRAPTRIERQAAGQLARALRRAAQPERTATTMASPTPPGRLRMRGALAADAQRAAGALPTARPFTRTVRKRVPQAPLRLGIALDVSGSMGSFARPVASTAWITATAAAAVPGTHTQTVIFGRHVRTITHPGAAPSRVTEFRCDDKRHAFPEAVDQLTATLSLDRPGGATRLLVVISDGLFGDDQRDRGESRLRRLAASGCHLLWITPDDTDDPIPPAHRVTLPGPAQVAGAIARAALRALTP